MSLLLSSLNNLHSSPGCFSNLSTYERKRKTCTEGKKCFCLSIYNWSNLYKKNLSPKLFYTRPNQPHPSETFPSILMCTWIWQCHVNLIKLNEKRRLRRRWRRRAAKTSEKFSFSSFTLKVSIRREKLNGALETRDSTDGDRGRWNGN